MRRLAFAVALTFVASCAVVHGSGRYARPPGGAPPGVLHARMLYAVDLGHPWEAARDRDELFWRAADVVQKRAAVLFKDAEVRRTGDDEIEVWLPSGTEEQFAAFRRFAPTPGRFRVSVVDNNSPYMLAFARRPPSELPPGVTLRPDAWELPPGGPTQEDVCLAAADAHQLAAAVDILVASAPLPPDREILIDRGPGGARTYFVIKSGGIDNAAIASAEVRPGWQGHPEVQIVLTPDGQRQFAELTTRVVGRKIAVALDGDVGIAPVVVSPITQGPLHLGGDTDPALDPATVRDDLEDLSAVLRSGPLPAPLTLRIEDRAYLRSTLR